MGADSRLTSPIVYLGQLDLPLNAPEPPTLTELSMLGQWQLSLQLEWPQRLHGDQGLPGDLK